MNRAQPEGTISQHVGHDDADRARAERFCRAPKQGIDRRPKSLLRGTGPKLDATFSQQEVGAGRRDVSRALLDRLTLLGDFDRNPTHAGQTRILAAVSDALATPKAIAYVRQRLAERAGSLSRDASRELAESSARLERTEERIRGLITMQADGDRSPMVAQMRADLEAQATHERAAIADLRALVSAPIHLPPVDLLTERVLSLRAPSPSPRTFRAPAPSSGATSKTAPSR
ncbi:MAG TPA: hypothetical protein VHC69_22145 [Polyangiaceae bacterium]|nr:hypothetical protein [Polyangiaceae bacterium]